MIDPALTGRLTFRHRLPSLPALPALAILGALFLDELYSQTSAAARAVPQALLLVVGVPLTYLSGRDLSSFPARIGWLFNYDYVNVPNVGRPWPLTNLYGDRYEYGQQVFFYTALATVAVLVLSLLVKTDSDSPPPSNAIAPTWIERLTSGPLLGVMSLVVAGLCFVGNAAAPSPEQVVAYSTSKLPPATELPRSLQLAYLVPAALCSGWLVITLWGLARSFGIVGRVARRTTLGLAMLTVAAIAWNCWVLDRFMVDISPHWSQKHVFASYFRLRSGPEEPILAWMMYWRGENFYTCNQIYDHRIEQSEKTAFCGDKNVEKMQAYFSSHRGKRVFFLIERHRLDTLRGLLPEESRKSLEVVDESNNKVYLARAQL